MICKHILLITFLNEPDLIFCTQSNDFNYRYLTLIILFDIYHLSANSVVVTSITIQHYLFICIQSNGFKYCYVMLIMSFKYCYI